MHRAFRSLVSFSRSALAFSPPVSLWRFVFASRFRGSFSRLALARSLPCFRFRAFALALALRRFRFRASAFALSLLRFPLCAFASVLPLPRFPFCARPLALSLSRFCSRPFALPLSLLRFRFRAFASALPLLRLPFAAFAPARPLLRNSSRAPGLAPAPPLNLARGKVQQASANTPFSIDSRGVRGRSHQAGSELPGNALCGSFALREAPAQGNEL